MPLPSNSAARKACPIATGFIDYFPDAIAAIAHLSKVGNDQHNPGKPLQWDRSKSGDEADALMRHFLERGTTDSDGIRHSAKVAWRALAMLQKEIEADLEAGFNGTSAEDFQVFGSVSARLINDEWLRLYQQSRDSTPVDPEPEPYPIRARTVEEVEDYIARLNTGYRGGVR